MKQTHKPFWELSIHPITGFKVPKYNKTEPVDPALRKKYGEAYRAKLKAKKLKEKGL